MSSRFTRRNAASASMPERKTNLCKAIRATQGKGVMPEAPAASDRGQADLHYMGCSTFANYTVLPEIALAKIRETRPSTRFATSAAG